jgi:hypothetical protein
MKQGQLQQHAGAGAAGRRPAVVRIVLGTQVQSAGARHVVYRHAVNRHVKSIDGLGRHSHADVLPL